MHTSRRRARRFEAALFVRFSVNGGPEHVSKTLNFTSRSLAIRSDCKASKGDHVVVRFGALPPIAGEVARVFPEGFAVVLNEASLELMSHTDNDAETDLAFDFHDISSPENIVSPFIRAQSIVPARMRITTTPNTSGAYNRHFLTVITSDAAPLMDVSSIWLKSDQTRWTARALHYRSRGDRGLAIIALNDWQLHMAAAHGLTLSVINCAMKDWSFAIDARPIADHLFALQPADLAVSA